MPVEFLYPLCSGIVVILRVFFQFVVLLLTGAKLQKNSVPLVDVFFCGLLLLVL